MFESFVELVQELYGTKDYIALHAPQFKGNERKYLMDVVDSTYVSSVGSFVDEFEGKLAEVTGARYVIATINGTAALHVALLLAGVLPSDEVITQSLTFVATCNAIHYCGARPLFVDVDRRTLGLSAAALHEFLEQYADKRDGYCINKTTGSIIRACVPMHTFGHPARLDEIIDICEQYCITIVEDAAESLGSLFLNKHTGTFGKISALSFNGNKIITTGGGGAVLTNDSELASTAKHITTTAKKPHRWAFLHDAIGFNYRMPNLNAALGLAQLESLGSILQFKQELAKQYISWGNEKGLSVFEQPKDSKSNYWLNTLILESEKQRDLFLDYTNKRKVSTRPVWTPMHRNSPYVECMRGDLSNTEWLANRILNVPSSPPK